MLRFQRVEPDLVEEKIIVNVVEGLRERNFLEGTTFKTRAEENGYDPYSVLLGFILGVATTVLVGLLTLEIWLPRAVSRLVGKSLRETKREVGAILAEGAT